jgi:hypothetical protein
MKHHKRPNKGDQLRALLRECARGDRFHPGHGGRREAPASFVALLNSAAPRRPRSAAFAVAHASSGRVDLQATLEGSMTPDATLLSRRYADLLRANGFSDRAIDNYLYALRSFIRFLGERPLSEATADDWNYARLPRPPRQQRLPEMLSAEEVEAILEARAQPQVWRPFHTRLRLRPPRRRRSSISRVDASLTRPPLLLRVP